MRLKAYAVHDAAVSAYLRPFFCRTSGEAIRSFRDAVNNQEHDFNRHADDYTLFEIGEYDEETGALIPRNPHSLGCAVEYLDYHAKGANPLFIGAEDGEA